MKCVKMQKLACHTSPDINSGSCKQYTPVPLSNDLCQTESSVMCVQTVIVHAFSASSAGLKINFSNTIFFLKKT